MESPLAKINGYQFAAHRAALSFFRWKRRYAAARHRQNRVAIKYRHLFKLPARESLALILLIGAHLAAAVTEGLLLAPVFEAMFVDLVHGFALKMASYLPVAVFWGMTFNIGRLFHKLRPLPHPIEPGNWSFDRPALVGGLTWAVFYLLFLQQIVQAAQVFAPNSRELADLILYTGVVEMGLGYCAVAGLEIGAARFVRWFSGLQAAFCFQKMEDSAQTCARQRLFYLQMIAEFARSENIEFVPEDNAQVDAAILFATGGKAEEEITEPNAPTGGADGFWE